MDTYRMYLRTLQQGLKLDPEETRTVIAQIVAGRRVGE